MRSKKQSAANSIAEKRLKKAVFYLDESIYSRSLLRRMRDEGANVEHPRGAIPAGAEDQDWLSECGKRGWIVLTRDQRIRHRRLELNAIQSHGVAAFCLTVGQGTADEVADIIEPVIQKIVNISVSETKPCLYTFGRSRRLNKVKLRAPSKNNHKK
jgi:hypothetical protein